MGLYLGRCRNSYHFKVLRLQDLQGRRGTIVIGHAFAVALEGTPCLYVRRWSANRKSCARAVGEAEPKPYDALHSVVLQMW